MPRGRKNNGNGNGNGRRPFLHPAPGHQGDGPGHRSQGGRDYLRPRPRDDQAIEDAEAKVKELTHESKDLAGKAKEIEDAVYDLKAVNPNKKPNVDTRTPEELMDIIEAKGREVAATLATLRGNKNSV
ncbi:MAG: hypothetical protein ABIK91_02695 [Pseudomonadota bacterium]